MTADPSAPAAHAAAMEAFGDALRPFLPVDGEGQPINRVVEFVEGDREVTRVAQVCERFGLSERSLQRLVDRWLGLTPKWLIQRRRLQEAGERLRAGPAGLGDVAAVLGYADQAHFTRGLRPRHRDDARAVRRPSFDREVTRAAEGRCLG